MSGEKKLTGIKIPTAFGRFFLTITQSGLHGLHFPGENHGRGHPTARSRSARRISALLKKYMQGEKVSFAGIKPDLSGFTAFERKILNTVHKVPYGTCRTYGDIAKSAGYPRAWRAVGLVMKKNRLPIFLPCHRIIRSGGGVGGYSKGLRWKKRFLDLEKRNA